MKKRVVKKKIKKSSKPSFYSKNFTYLVVAAVVLVMVGVVLAVGFSGTYTGASIFVKYHGVSDYPLETQSGKMQTVIKLTQPTLINLREKVGQVEVATDIAEVSEFPKGVEELYLSNPLTALPLGAIKELRVAVNKENLNFAKDLDCLRSIGENHGAESSLSVTLVSELKLQRCGDESNLWSAYLKHTYFNNEGQRFLCQYDSQKLFLVNEDTGEISREMSSC